METKQFGRVWKNTSFRLTVWYALIFAFSTFILFGWAYFLLEWQVRESDRRVAQNKLANYVITVNEHGLGALVRTLKRESAVNHSTGFFVRLADPFNRTVFQTLPSGWRDLDASLLGRKHFSDTQHWVVLKHHGSQEELEITSFNLNNDITLQVGFSSGKRSAVFRHFRQLFLFITWPIILLGIVGGYFVAHRSLRPIRDLIHAIKGIDLKNMDARVHTRQSEDELGELVLLFNDMLEKIKVLILGMRSSLDNVAHDLRTPLARLRVGLESAISTKGSKEELIEALQESVEETDQINTMLKMLMDISEAETGAMKLNLAPTPVAPILEDVRELYEYVAEDKGVVFTVATECSRKDGSSSASIKDVQALADANRLRQVLANLVDNGIKYTNEGGELRVHVRRKDDVVEIVVQDTGVGIPENDLPHIFERLYRGDKSRSERGLGLGLSLVRAIISAHEGSIDVQSTPGKGAMFTITLPGVGSD